MNIKNTHKHIQKKISSRRGFTLIEILILIAIIGIMTSVVLVSMQGSKDREALKSAARTLAADIRAAQSDALMGVGAEKVNDGDIACNSTIRAIRPLQGVPDRFSYWSFLRYGTGVEACDGIGNGGRVTTTYKKHSLSNGVNFLYPNNEDNDIRNWGIRFHIPRGESFGVGFFEYANEGADSGYTYDNGSFPIGLTKNDKCIFVCVEPSGSVHETGVQSDKDKCNEYTEESGDKNPCNLPFWDE